MKRLFSLLLALLLMLSLCACQGNFGSVNLKAPMDIPEDGVISKTTIEQIKSENAIAVFTGTSGDLKYEWTIFGSAIRETKAANLRVQLTETAEGDISVVLRQTEAFGFSATLSIHLNKQWNAESATAYIGEEKIASVSITGSKNTILNLSLDGTVQDLVIRPDALLDDQTPTNTAKSLPRWLVR